jgi:hypothetical protein
MIRVLEVSSVTLPITDNLSRYGVTVLRARGVCACVGQTGSRPPTRSEDIILFKAFSQRFPSRTGEHQAWTFGEIL